MVKSSPGVVDDTPGSQSIFSTPTTRLRPRKRQPDSDPKHMESDRMTRSKSKSLGLSNSNIAGRVSFKLIGPKTKKISRNFCFFEFTDAVAGPSISPRTPRKMVRFNLPDIETSKPKAKDKSPAPRKIRSRRYTMAF